MKHALTGSRCTRQTSPAAFGPLRTFAGCRFSFVGVSRRSRSAVYSPGRLQRRVGAAGVASLGRSCAERADCPAVLGLAPRRGTHCVRCALYARTTATRMLTSRAAREGARPGLAGRAGPVAQPLARHKQSTGVFVSGARLLGAPEGAPPAAPTRLCSQASGVRVVGARTTEQQRPSLAAGGTRRGRFLGRRGTQPWGRRAQRASLSFWPRLSERRERSERSEFRGPTPGRQRTLRRGSQLREALVMPEPRLQGSRRVQRRPPQHEPPPGAAWREARQREVVGGQESTTAMGRKRNVGNS